jgi:hypothetical protein
MESLSVEEQQ